MASTEYDTWITRLSELLTLDPETLSPGTGSSDAWLLASPPGLELDPDQGQNLLSAVRSHLTGAAGGNSPSKVAKVIGQLDGTALIPLLYAARYISRVFASPHKYWPFFREYLLGPHIPDSYYQPIAPAMTRAWLRLYAASGRTLYFPTEGPVNIKWPTSHAGLLEADLDDPTDPLVIYACELRSAADGDIPGVLLVEPQEFHQDLESWFRERPAMATRRIGKLVTNPVVGLLTAERIQLQLRTRIADFECTRAVRTGPIRRRPSARLVFDDARQALWLRIDPGAVFGSSHAEITVFGETRSVTGRLDVTANLHIFREVSIRVTDKMWSGDVAIDYFGVDQAVRLRLPESPFSTSGKGALLFESGSGRQTRRWQPGAPFVLLMDSALTTHEWREQLFTISAGAPEPVPSLENIVAVHCDASPIQDRDEWDVLAEVLIDELSKDNVAVVLPSSEVLFRPHISVLGVITERRSDVDVIQPSPALLVAIDGEHLDQQNAAIERWDPTTASYEPITSSSLTNIGGRHFAGFEGDQALDPGTWRLIVAQTEHIIRVESNQVEFKSTQFAIGLAENEQPVDSESVERTDLLVSRQQVLEQRLTVSGWPGADVVIWVRGDTVAHHRLNLDTDGVGSLLLSPDAVPHGSFEINATFHGNTSNVIYVSDTAMVRRDSWEFDRSTGEFTATLLGTNIPSSVTICRIGRCPWNADLYATTVPVIDGHVSADLGSIGSDPEAIWVVVTNDGPSDDPVLLAATLVAGRAPKYAGRDLRGGDFADWGPLANRVSRSPIPAGLALVLRASGVAKLMTDSAAFLHGDVWRRTGSLDQAEMLGDLGRHQTVFLEENVNEWSTQFIRPARLIRIDGEWQIEYGTEHAAAHIEEVEDSLRISARDGPDLGACLTCGAVVPSLEAVMRHQGSGPLSRCSSFMPVGVDDREPVVLFHSGSASRLLRDLGSALLAGAESNDPPPTALLDLVADVQATLVAAAVPAAGIRTMLNDAVALALHALDALEKRYLFDIAPLATIVEGRTVPAKIASILLERSLLMQEA